MIISVNLRVFISFTKQFFTFHSNRMKCEKQILPSVRFEPEGKIWFSHNTLLECNLKNCFVKLIKTLKINRKSYFVRNDDILLIISANFVQKSQFYFKVCLRFSKLFHMFHKFFIFNKRNFFHVRVCPSKIYSNNFHKPVASPGGGDQGKCSPSTPKMCKGWETAHASASSEPR